MKALAALALVVYFAAWWLTFWLPLRKYGSMGFLAFIPAAVCAVAVPIIVSDIRLETPTLFLMVWFAVPMVALTTMLVRGRRRPAAPVAPAPPQDAGRRTPSLRQAAEP